MKKYIILAALLFASGCAVKTHKLNIYDLSSNVQISTNRHSNSVLMVKYPHSLGAIGGSRIYYKKGDLTSYYLYSSWSQSLNRMIYSEVLKTLSNSHKYKSVIGFNSSAKADLNLEIEILDFYHIVEDSNSYADISIAVKLIDSNGNILKDRVFKYKIDIDEVNAQGFIKASKEAINRFLQELIQTL